MLSGYSPSGTLGTVKLIWNNPTPTRPAKDAFTLVEPIFTTTVPAKAIVLRTMFPAGELPRPVA